MNINVLLLIFAQVCGDGNVDPGENCTTCPEDAPCPQGCEVCLFGECYGCPIPPCGDGVVDPGENCSTCPEDVPCIGCLECVNSKCVPSALCNCGDGIIDPGENCSNCKADVPCGDGFFCDDGKCIQKCNPGVFPMEVIFLFDTSGSMDDEIVALCGALDGIQSDLEAFGLEVTIDVWGIAPGISIPCLTGFANQYGPLHNEAWAPAVSLVSASHQWITNTRILVPISDEGPYNGDPCDTPEDQQSIADAIVAANENNVFVSPIMGTPWGIDPECIEAFGKELADGTGGTWYSSTGVDMQDIVLELIQATLCGCQGDIDGDGTVGVLDFLLLLAGWLGPGGDVDGDGDTDQIDLLLLLQGWGPC